MNYYDPEGRPLGLLEWANMTEPRNTIRKRNAVRGYFVSTIWLGIDRSWDGGTPLIFETMVFGPNTCNVVNRYPSKATAWEGHRYAVEALTRLLARRTRRKTLYHLRRR